MCCSSEETMDWIEILFVIIDLKDKKQTHIKIVYFFQFSQVFIEVFNLKDKYFLLKLFRNKFTDHSLTDNIKVISFWGHVWEKSKNFKLNRISTLIRVTKNENFLIIFTKKISFISFISFIELFVWFPQK